MNIICGQCIHNTGRTTKCLACIYEGGGLVNNFEAAKEEKKHYRKKKGKRKIRLKK